MNLNVGSKKGTKLALAIFTLLIFLHESFSDDPNPQIYIDKKVLDFNYNETTDYINYTNHGSDKMLVKFIVKSINKGDTKGSNYASNTIYPEIVIIPKKLFLSPGQSYKVKIIKKKSDITSDALFKIYGTAYSITVGDGKKTVTKQANTVSSINTLVITRPKVLSPKINTSKIFNKLLIENVGNTTVNLHQIEQYNEKVKISYEDELIYPNAKIYIPIKFLDAPVKLVQQTRDHNKKITIS